MNHILHFPIALDWMWNYCTYVGGFTDSRGENYDLGFFMHPNGAISKAIVYGNESFEYISGPMDDSDVEPSKELRRRLIHLRIME